jgi:hypothetical protein
VTAGSCSRDDFAVVVEAAAATLRDLNAKNTPAFQKKLRDLKDRRKWSHAQFMELGAPYVRDDQIVAFDGKINGLLNKIEGMGDGGSGKEPNCDLLAELKGHMDALVKTTMAKWDYMFAKLEKDLAVAN